jgi:RNA polymerase primary sigma factor
LALDDVKKLIDAGKEKGYLAYNEVNDLIPNDVRSPEDLDDVLATIGTLGIDVLERQPKLPSALEKGLENEVEASDEVELDLTPGALEKTNDPVRIYLREMGASPLLSREGEVDVAKRIERGKLSALKALSRSPLVIHQVLAIGDDLKRGLRSIKETVVFDEEEITEEILQDRAKDITRRIDELHKHYKTAHRLAGRLATLPAKKKAREYRRCRCQLGREIVRISIIIRNLGFTNSERKHLADRVNKTAEIMHSLDRQLSNLETKIASTHNEELKKKLSHHTAAASRRHEKARKRCRRDVPGTAPHAAQNHPGRDGRGAGQARAH